MINISLIFYTANCLFRGSKPKNKIASSKMNFLIHLFKILNIPTNPKKVVDSIQLADILGWACTTIPISVLGIADKKRIKYILFLEVTLLRSTTKLKILEKVDGYVRHTC